MTLAVVRSIDAPRQMATAQEAEDFEQELVDHYLLAGVGAGLADTTLARERVALFDFIAFLSRRCGPRRLTTLTGIWLTCVRTAIWRA